MSRFGRTPWPVSFQFFPLVPSCPAGFGRPSRLPVHLSLILIHSEKTLTRRGQCAIVNQFPWEGKSVLDGAVLLRTIRRGREMSRQPDSFTLIELLIVVAIIGILAAIAVPNFLNAQIRAKIGRVQSEFTTIRTAFEMYRMDGNGRLPDAWTIGGWYVAWRCFTTPVAYLPSVPIDIFQPKEKEYFVNQHNFYEFAEAYRTAAGTQKDWALASLGPDREDDTLEFGNYPNSNKWVSYASSNGLVSDGDVLFETHPGLNPNRW